VHHLATQLSAWLGWAFFDDIGSHQLAQTGNKQRACEISSLSAQAQVKNVRAEAASVAL
jgi:hypothetical protein